MEYEHGGRTFSLMAEHDGDFWFVGVYETIAGETRLRFEYKLNTPRDEAAACARAWEIFKARQLDRVS
ncbi:MAG: hypothetical protein O2954_01390 [bacterium]|nr:hypothetical protein [bacterium]